MKDPSILQQSLLELIFSGRNHAYGAYELRLHYFRRLKKALLSMVLLVVVAGIALRLSFHGSHATTPPTPAMAVTLSALEEVPPAESEVVPPPPGPQTPPPQAAPSTAYTPFKVVKDQQFTPQDAPPDISAIRVTAIGSTNTPGFADGTGVTLEPATGNGHGATERASAPFVSVEQMPRFPRAHSDEQSAREVMAYLSERIRYPDQAREHGIQGTVVIRFVVGPDGKLSDIQLTGSDPGGGIAEEALRVVRGMPRWIPGKQNGRPVSVWFTLPVRFSLH